MRVIFRSCAVILASSMGAGIAMGAPASTARSGDLPTPLALRSLERTMSRSTVLGFQLAIQRGFEQGKQSQRFLDCANRVDPGRLAPIFKARLERALTPEEVEAIERFWKSDAGEHLAAIQLAQVYHGVGMSPATVPPPLTDAENAQVEEPATLRASRKLEAALAQLPMDEMRTSLTTIYKECKAEGG